MYHTAPVLFEFGARIIRISKTLALKGGGYTAPSEARNMIFAAKQKHLRVPRVHRVFQCRLPEEPDEDTCFILMDYIPGMSLDRCWSSLDDTTRLEVISQISSMIESMQSIPLNHMPPGPIGGSAGAPFRGCWFSDYSAGPFETSQELEDWLNHKRDVCLRFKRIPRSTPRFEVRDVVLTHQDIAPRNIMLDPDKRVWLIDWAHAGIYPQGFEQAALVKQSRDRVFSDMILSQLTERHDTWISQLYAITFGLTTAALA
jgi:hypothetical protein